MYRTYLMTLLAAFALVVAACGSSTDDNAESAESTSASASEPAEASTETTEAAEEADVATGDEPRSVRLITHDSFALSDGTLAAFTAETGIEVELLQGGDAGEVVAKAILSVGAPEADVLFGIDNTFLQRGLDAELFVPYESPTLASVPDELELDQGEFRVTPIDFGHVCVNYWTESVPGGSAPTSLDDLTAPDFASSFVTQDPESSSPGFAFLLATIAAYGDGWEDYWQQLADNGVTVTSGWSDAYYGEFVAGGGEKAIVTSYASSPVAEVLFADPPVDAPPTGVVLDSCFRQIEFAGILAGTERQAEAEALIDFMLSDTFQADIPLNMFVAPANADVPLPEVYLDHDAAPTDYWTLMPAEIEANRADWTERWREIVLG
ncbi:MAG: thiamine ABC transporter substrate-binding protein [Actinomycetota bacterium]